MSEVKVCKKCGIKKPRNEFGRCVYDERFIKHNCKECTPYPETPYTKYSTYYDRNTQARKGYYEANKEKAIARSKKWAEANPGRVKTLRDRREKLYPHYYAVRATLAGFPEQYRNDPYLKETILLIKKIKEKCNARQLKTSPTSKS